MQSGCSCGHGERQIGIMDKECYVLVGCAVVRERKANDKEVKEVEKTRCTFGIIQLLYRALKILLWIDCCEDPVSLKLAGCFATDSLWPATRFTLVLDLLVGEHSVSGEGARCRAS